MKKKKKKYHKLAFLGVILPIILLLDQWTKALVQRSFAWGETRAIVEGFFNLTYVRNQGAAFGFLNSAPSMFREPFFIIVPVLVMFLIAFLFWKAKESDWISAAAFSLVLSGAFGNLLDRVRLGYVVDFLDFHWKHVYHWPAFNVADSAIVVGVLFLFLQSLRKPASS